jgi:hypothetical protein
MVLRTRESITLDFRRLVGGTPQTGLSVTVKVLNRQTGATLLAETAMTEVTPGLYVYVWANASTVKRHCLAIYSTQSKQYDERFTIDDLMDKVDQSDGRVV